MYDGKLQVLENVPTVTLYQFASPFHHHFFKKNDYCPQHFFLKTI